MAKQKIETVREKIYWSHANLAMAHSAIERGDTEKLAFDHIFPQKYGGKDQTKNLVFACRSYKSSKEKNDLMAWMAGRSSFCH